MHRRQIDIPEEALESRVEKCVGVNGRVLSEGQIPEARADLIATLADGYHSALGHSTIFRIIIHTKHNSISEIPLLIDITATSCITF